MEGRMSDCVYGKGSVHAVDSDTHVDESCSDAGCNARYERDI